MVSGTFLGILTLVLLLMFIGIWLWAWSGKRKNAFEEAAQLPLEDNREDAANSGGQEHAKKQDQQEIDSNE